VADSAPCGLLVRLSGSREAMYQIRFDTDMDWANTTTTAASQSNETLLAFGLNFPRAGVGPAGWNPPEALAFTMLVFLAHRVAGPNPLPLDRSDDRPFLACALPSLAVFCQDARSQALQVARQAPGHARSLARR